MILGLLFIKATDVREKSGSEVAGHFIDHGLCSLEQGTGSFQISADCETASVLVAEKEEVSLRLKI